MGHISEKAFRIYMHSFFSFDVLIISFYVSYHNRFEDNYTFALVTRWVTIESVILDSLTIIPTSDNKAAALTVRAAAI